MQYANIRRAVFQARPNRFIAQVTLEDGSPETAHVKNTGRCAELLVPGCTVYLTYSDNSARKTPCDLVAVEKQTPAGPLLINMDSAAPNAAVAEWLKGGGMGELDALRAEYRVGDSRFDFYAERAGSPLFIEVKGCTLEQNGTARFPDAPTLRGVKHLRELAALAGMGHACAVLFVLQFKGARCFAPNWATHPGFGQAMIAAEQAGVRLLAMDCLVTPDSMRLNSPVPIDLRPPCGAEE